MRCLNCDYALWNLTTGVCPECGCDFKPSTFEFKPYQVKFLCPHCDQDYYGTSDKGHLEPARFECVQCQNDVHMDDMRLLPALEEDIDSTDVLRYVPWEKRTSAGLGSAWYRTVIMALFHPNELGRSITTRSSTASAMWFAVLSSVPIYLLSWSPFVIFPALAGGPIYEMLIGVAVLTFFSAVGMLVGLLVWGLIAHAIIAVGTPDRRSIGTTYKAICYASGANVASAVPLVGIYVGWIWMVISSIVALLTLHRTSTTRAILAGISMPLLVIFLSVGLFLLTYASIQRTMQTAMQVANQAQSVGVLAPALVTFEQDNTCRHALELLDADNALVASFDTEYPPELAYGELFEDVTGFVNDGPAERAATMFEQIQKLGDDPVYHQICDVIFVFHGMHDLSADQRVGLWIALHDERHLLGVNMVTAEFEDGSYASILAEEWAEALIAQNNLRKDAKLPPLPDFFSGP